MTNSLFEVCSAEGFEIVLPYNQEDYDVLFSFNGESKASTWKPIRVRRLPGHARRKFYPADFSGLGMDPLVMRRRAVEVLRDLLETNGEILPLASTDGVELFVFNAQVVDAMDEERSVVERSPETNQIIWIKKVAFVDDKIAGLDLFRLSHRASSTFVSERFVERVQQAGLTGLTFRKVWPAPADPAPSWTTSISEYDGSNHFVVTTPAKEWHIDPAELALALKEFWKETDVVLLDTTQPDQPDALHWTCQWPDKSELLGFLRKDLKTIVLQGNGAFIEESAGFAVWFQKRFPQSQDVLFANEDGSFFLRIDGGTVIDDDTVSLITEQADQYALPFRIKELYEAGEPK